MTGKSLRQVEHVRGHTWDTDIPERLLFESGAVAAYHSGIIAR
jgi:hypothetical protein